MPKVSCQGLTPAAQARVTNRQRGVELDIAWLKGFAEIALGKCLRHPAYPGTVLPGLELVDVVIVSDKAIADVHWRFMNIPGGYGCDYF